MERQPTFNADLARRVLAYIREHPHQHLQTTYVDPASGGELQAGSEGGEPDVLDVAEGVKPTEAGEYLCMTTACIAGWAVALAGPEAVTVAWNRLSEGEQVHDPWFETGRRLLGLTPAEANRVFLEFDDQAALAHLEVMIQGGSVAW